MSNLIVTYKQNDVCPICGGDVVRQDFTRHGFCKGDCNILLLIPSRRESEKKAVPVCWSAGDNPPEMMTREHYELISRAVMIVAAN